MNKERIIEQKDKLKAVQDYMDGKASLRALGRKYDVHHSSVEKWVNVYRTFGEDGLKVSEKYIKYSKELKEKAVQDYLVEELSLKEICRKYQIRSISQLQIWIRQHNS